MEYINFEILKQKLGLVCEYPHLLAEYGANTEKIRKIYDSLLESIETAKENFESLQEEYSESCDEPNDYGLIVKESEGGNRKTEAGDLYNKIKGALIGRFAGCTLGTPVENWPVEKMQKKAEVEGSEFPPEYYWKTVANPSGTHYGEIWYYTQRDVMDGVPTDDDVTYTLLNLLILEKYGKNFTAEDVGEFWKEYLPMACTAEEMALNNLKNGVPAEKAAEIDNPYSNLIGALIRADAFGYSNAGDPHEAAREAYYDAYLTHRRNGIYGEMLFAAAIAAAFVCNDAVEAVKTGMKEIPKNSMLYKDMEWAFSVLPEIKDIYHARELVDSRFKGMHCVHTNNNACLILFSLYLGRNDLSKTISYAVGLGLDNDCTAATAGSIAGAIQGFDRIDEKWYRPFNNKVRTYINGFPEFKIDDAAERFEKLNS